MRQDRVLSRFVIAKFEDVGATIHSLSTSNQTLPLKKGIYVDQAHAAQMRVSLHGIITCEWYPYHLTTELKDCWIGTVGV